MHPYLGFYESAAPGAQTNKLHSDNVRLEARCGELEAAARAALGDAAAWRARYEDLARRAGGAAPTTPHAPADRRVRARDAEDGAALWKGKDSAFFWGGGGGGGPPFA